MPNAESINSLSRICHALQTPMPTFEVTWTGNNGFSASCVVFGKKYVSNRFHESGLLAKANAAAQALNTIRDQLILDVLPDTISTPGLTSYRSRLEEYYALIAKTSKCIENVFGPFIFHLDIRPYQKTLNNGLHIFGCEVNIGRRQFNTLRLHTHKRMAEEDAAGDAIKAIMTCERQAGLKPFTNGSTIQSNITIARHMKILVANGWVRMGKRKAATVPPPFSLPIATTAISLPALPALMSTTFPMTHPFISAAPSQTQTLTTTMIPSINELMLTPAANEAHEVSEARREARREAHGEKKRTNQTELENPSVKKCKE